MSTAPTHRSNFLLVVSPAAFIAFPHLLALYQAVFRVSKISALSLATSYTKCISGVSSDGVHLVVLAVFTFDADGFGLGLGECMMSIADK